MYANIPAVDPRKVAAAVEEDEGALVGDRSPDIKENCTRPEHEVAPRHPMPTYTSSHVGGE